MPNDTEELLKCYKDGEQVANTGGQGYKYTCKVCELPYMHIRDGSTNSCPHCERKEQSKLKESITKYDKYIADKIIRDSHNENIIMDLQIRLAALETQFKEEDIIPLQAYPEPTTLRCPRCGTKHFEPYTHEDERETFWGVKCDKCGYDYNIG